MTRDELQRAIDEQANYWQRRHYGARVTGAMLGQISEAISREVRHAVIVTVSDGALCAYPAPPPLWDWPASGAS